MEDSEAQRGGQLSQSHTVCQRSNWSAQLPDQAPYQDAPPYPVITQTESLPRLSLLREGVPNRGETGVFRVSERPLTLDKQDTMLPVPWDSMTGLHQECGRNRLFQGHHSIIHGALWLLSRPLPVCLLLLSTLRRHVGMSPDFSSREEWLEPPNVKVWESLAAEVG